jgi:hypothetical protein
MEAIDMATPKTTKTNRAAEFLLLVSTCDDQDLKMLQELITLRYRTLEATKAADFHVGDRVWFKISRGRRAGCTVRGTVTALGKNIKIEADEASAVFGARWRVSPLYLNREESNG